MWRLCGAARLPGRCDVLLMLAWQIGADAMHLHARRVPRTSSSGDGAGARQEQRQGLPAPEMPLRTGSGQEGKHSRQRPRLVGWRLACMLGTRPPACVAAGQAGRYGAGRDGAAHLCTIA